MNQSKQITDGAIFTAIYIILLLFTIFIPFLQMFGMFLLAVPFVIYTSIHGFKPALMVGVVALIISLVVATLISIPLTLLATFGGISIGEAIYRKKDAYTTLAYGTIGFIMALVAVFILTELVFSVHIFSQIDEIIEESLEMSKSLLSNLPNTMNSEDTFEIVAEQMYGFKDLIPAMIILMAMAFSFIGQWVSYKVLNRTKQQSLYFPPFKNLNFPLSLFYVYLIVIILSFVSLDSEGILYLIYRNAELICVSFLSIQGLSFIFFYFAHKKINRAVPITILIVSILIPFFMYLIRIIGIIDLGFSLKNKLANQGKSK